MLRHHLTRLVACVISALLLLITSVDSASAGGNAYATEDGAAAKADGTRSKNGSGGHHRAESAVRSSRSTKPQPTYLSKGDYAKQMAAWKAQVVAAQAHNGALATSWNQCVSTSGDYACGQYLVGNQALPGQPNIAIAGDPRAAAPPIPPEVVAYQAVAELKLRAPNPVIGPDPKLNKWDTAVVGYPLWLAVDGDTTPPPVTDSVYDVSVSLQARLTKVVFAMGDGRRVTCSGAQVTHPWTPSVATNAESPWCGYTYQSIPKGSRTYAVTANAYWAVDWQVNGATGTLPFHQSTTVQLPVSELQVLTR
jgi:hypothetical protein